MEVNAVGAFAPKVSIIIPVYNGAEYMREAIDSALRQTYKNIEILVINDGSCDDGETEKIARSYGEKIRYFSKENGGVSSALNLGIAQMTGEYFSWLSHDDKYEPDKVKTSVQLLGKFGGREDLVAFTGSGFINAKSELIRTLPQLFPPEKVCSGEEVVSFLLKQGTLNGCCMLIPKSAFLKCGGFNEGLRYNQDALMWYLIFTNGYSLVSDAQTNVMYRQHEKQTSNTRRDLLLHDTVEAGKILIPLFIEHSTKENNLLLQYTCRNAKYNCAPEVRECVRAGRAHKLFTPGNILYIYLYSFYGKLRETLKKLYTRIRFKK